VIRLVGFYVDELREGLLIAFGAIRANKMRSVLTAVGIFIGILSVTLMGTAIEGLNRAFNTSISAIGADVLYVQKFPWGGGHNWWEMRNRENINIQHARKLERQADLAMSVSPIIGTSRNVKYQRKIVENAIIVGTDEEFTTTSNVNVALGRWLTALEVSGGRPVCVLGSEIAEGLFPNMTPMGRTVKVGGIPYRVVGVLERQGSFLGMQSMDNRVYLPINQFFKKFMSHRRGGIDVWVKAASLELVDEAKEEVRGIMRKARGLSPKEDDDFAINQQEMIVETFNAIGAVVAGFGLFVTGLSLFVGGIGIMNIMFVSVTERTKEIGLRKAIGAPQRTILTQFLIEAAALSLIGGLLGVGVAFPLSLIIDQILPTAMPLNIVAIALFVSVMVGVISGFLPAFRASRLDPVDAIRYE